MVVFFEEIAGEILETALEKFVKNTGLAATINSLGPGKSIDPETRVSIGIPGSMQSFSLVPLPRPSILPTDFTDALQFSLIARQQCLFVTEYVDPETAGRLREANIFFIDSAGNAYCNLPPLYIFVTGQARPKGRRPAVRSQVLSRAGLKVAFCLLSVKNLENQPFRVIAQAASVALGTVAKVMSDLAGMGFLVEDGRDRRLVNRQTLVRDWVHAYAKKLRPGLVVGRYRAMEPGWLAEADLVPVKAYWGGEIAVPGVDRNSVENITIYAAGSLGRLLLKSRLKPDDQGGIEILQAFWAQGILLPGQDAVPPLLIYADLLAGGQARQARKVYNLEIRKILG